MAITPEPSAESKQDEGKKPITVARRGVAPSPTVSKPPSATRSKSAKKMTADTKNKTDEVVFTNIESSKRDKAKFVELSAHDVVSTQTMELSSFPYNSQDLTCKING